jgi:hypothetical protein
VASILNASLFTGAFVLWGFLVRFVFFCIVVVTPSSIS